MNVPLYLQVEITSRCNLKCRMCPLTLGNTITSAEEGNLDDASWDDIKRYARHVGHVLISGYGEPMTNVRFLPMLQELDALGVQTSFSTNAIGAEHIAPQLGELRKLVSANVSIDSPDPDIYQDIRGGELSRVLKGLEALLASLGSRVSVSSVAMTSNLTSLKAFPELLARLGVKTYAVQPMVEWDARLGPEHLYTQDWETNVINEIRAACEERSITFVVTPKTEMEMSSPDSMLVQFHTAGIRKLSETKPCIIPFESIYIDSQANVFPCCHSAGQSVLGNLHVSTLEQIVNGAEMRRFQNDLLDAETTPDVCRACNVVPLGPHPFRTYRAQITELTRDGDTFRLVAQNLGTLPWDAEREIRVSATHPRDRVSVYYHPTWINGGRVTRAREAVVNPGEFATFEWQIVRNEANLPELFQLLVEYHAWLPDTFFHLPEPARLRLSDDCRTVEPALL
jgi:radical SAM protein with 4Fe4S-binding SPASM domain